MQKLGKYGAIFYKFYHVCTPLPAKLRALDSWHRPRCSAGARHAQASAWAGLVGFAQEEGTRLVRGPADTAKHLGADLCFRVEIVIYRVEIEI